MTSVSRTSSVWPHDPRDPEKPLSRRRPGNLSSPPPGELALRILVPFVSQAHALDQPSSRAPDTSCPSDLSSPHGALRSSGPQPPRSRRAGRPIERGPGLPATSPSRTAYRSTIGQQIHRRKLLVSDAHRIPIDGRTYLLYGPRSLPYVKVRHRNAVVPNGTAERWPVPPTAKMEVDISLPSPWPHDPDAGLLCL
jgi:hypothetical protein